VRFHTTFTRIKGGGTPVLGADTAPTTAPPSNQDCVMSCNVRDIAGWPVARIAAAWTTTAAVPVALNGSLYIFEKSLAHWFLINATPLSMAPNQLCFFDVASLIEQVSNKGNVVAGQATKQSIDVYLLMADPGAAVNGTYQIGMGPDLSNVGT
jgi:hypothetical protein